MTETKFHISFNENTSLEDSCQGSILLAGTPESFIASLSYFPRASYVKQWADAIRTVKHDRKPSALFSNVDLKADGTGWLWFYTLIPSEDIYSENAQEKGVFITQSFKPVCTDPNSFLTRRFIELEDGTVDEELSFYFLDLKHPERFFGYLDTEICGRSHWFVNDTDIQLSPSS